MAIITGIMRIITDAAVIMGKDIDQPRKLAKNVKLFRRTTVEQQLRNVVVVPARVGCA